MARKGKLGNKASKDNVERPKRWRKYKEILLIVCEDENTEPEYFRRFRLQFPDETMFVREVGTGLDPLGIAERAIKEVEKLQNESGKEVDHIWLVFDVDDAAINVARQKRFAKAFEIALTNNFKVAWSNEAFELWLLLHVMNIAARPAIPRADIYNLLQQGIRSHHTYEYFNYVHGQEEVIDAIAIVGDENLAIQYAHALAVAHAERLPINANPCTHVYKLVIELRQWIAWYQSDPNV